MSHPQRLRRTYSARERSAALFYWDRGDVGGRDDDCEDCHDPIPLDLPKTCRASAFIAYLG
jgi:hypothetical protein